MKVFINTHNLKKRLGVIEICKYAQLLVETLIRSSQFEVVTETTTTITAGDVYLDFITSKVSSRQLNRLRAVKEVGARAYIYILSHTYDDTLRTLVELLHTDDVLLFASRFHEKTFFESFPNTESQPSSTVLKFGYQKINPSNKGATDTFRHQILIVDPQGTNSHIAKDLTKVSHDLQHESIVLSPQGWRQFNRFGKWRTYKEKTLHSYLPHAKIIIYLPTASEDYHYPLVAALAEGIPVITGKQSSAAEMGGELVDYALNDLSQEFAQYLQLYCLSPELYSSKTERLKTEFQAISISAAASNLARLIEYNERPLPSVPNQLQYVFISIKPDIVAKNIAQNDKLNKLTKEYIIFTQPQLIKKFRSIRSSHPVAVYDEVELLGKNYKLFTTSQHVRKNWLLRSALAHFEKIDQYFVMLDDDNMPLKQVTRKTYLTNKNQIKGYYYHDLIDWGHHSTDYDNGQRDSRNLLEQNGCELLSYSSHMPQLINKAVFGEVVDLLYRSGLKKSIDEWDVYFNYLASTRPSQFRKTVFVTMNWPGHPNDWWSNYWPTTFQFENYYEGIYEPTGYFHGLTLNDRAKKVAIKNKQMKPYIETQKLMQWLTKLAQQRNNVSKLLRFQGRIGEEIIITGLSPLIGATTDSYLKLNITYKLLNTDRLASYKLVIENTGGIQTEIEFPKADTAGHLQEGLMILPVHASTPGVHEIRLRVMAQGYEFRPLTDNLITYLIMASSRSAAERVAKDMV